eukprot:5038176-Amphidinium_carterae.1
MNVEPEPQPSCADDTFAAPVVEPCLVDSLLARLHLGEDSWCGLRQLLSEGRYQSGRDRLRRLTVDPGEDLVAAARTLHRAEAAKHGVPHERFHIWIWPSQGTVLSQASASVPSAPSAESNLPLSVDQSGPWRAAGSHPQLQAAESILHQTLVCPRPVVLEDSDAPASFTEVRVYAIHFQGGPGESVDFVLACVPASAIVDQSLILANIVNGASPSPPELLGTTELPPEFHSGATAHLELNEDMALAMRISDFNEGDNEWFMSAAEESLEDP